MQETIQGTHTPGFEKKIHLGHLASRYLDIDALPWVPSRFPGVDIKV